VLAERIGRFKHVVFADPLNGGRCSWRGGKAIDLSTTVPSDIPREASALACRLDAATDAFVQRIFKQADLDVSNYRCETLARRIPACLRSLRARSLEHAETLLRRDPRLISLALEQLLIGVTSFFRDDAVFDSIAQTVLPELANRRRPLRIWSAGCSSGAELYSIGMLLAEQGLLDDSILLGTDCREHAIRSAKGATFDAACFTQIPAELARQYLIRRGDRFRVRADLVEQTRWQCADLLGSLEPGGWDMILCRNLAMYLSPASAGKLWEELASLLLPGGWLIAGKAERPVPVRRLRAVASCVFQRQN